MDENNTSGQSASTQAVMQEIDADWKRRKARLIRSLSETPLDRWLRRRR